MNVKEIVKNYLVGINGIKYDGLVSSDGECGCEASDLMPCLSENIESCQPGYKIPCDCGDHDFHITTKKPPERRP